jgi:hypothetical protein
MDDANLIRSFEKLAGECRKFSLKMHHAVMPALKRFEQVLSQASTPQIIWIRDAYYSELGRIRTTLQSMDPMPRSLFDKVYTKHLKMTGGFPMYVTRIFEDFIKGVTYFEHEQDPTAKPIYHRLYSCGPYADTHRTGNLVCTDMLNANELKRRRNLIERCYIERMIFNKIFKTEALHFPQSGNAVIFRMDLTKEDFETCFPNTTIDIDVVYADGLPMQLIVIRNQNGTVTRTESTRTMSETYGGGRVYDSLVQCVKRDNGRTYFKISTFTNPSRFQLTEELAQVSTARPYSQNVNDMRHRV